MNCLNNSHEIIAGYYNVNSAPTSNFFKDGTAAVSKQKCCTIIAFPNEME